MKTKKLLAGALLILFGFSARAQNGLENITVEKYYISNAADAAKADQEINDYNTANGTTLPTGALPVGSVTYRIYADMLPGWKVLAVYGNGQNSQPLSFTTTTSFYNNLLGTLSPVPGTSKAAIKNNLLALDSYYSLGAVCTGNYGILKSEDNTTGNNVTVATNPDGVLLNTDAAMGDALTLHDGMIAGTGIVSPSTAGFTPAMEAVLNDGTVLSNSFVLPDGSWFTSATAVGPVPATNKLLIAQITTDGTFHYEISVQIKNDATGENQYYSYAPVAGDLVCPGLSGTFGPNVAPTVNITTPANGANFLTGDVVAITASASDVAPGTVTSVQFFVDGVSLSTDNTAPYEASYPSVAGTHSLTAKATDNIGQQTTSAAVIITVANDPFPSVSITAPANGSSVVAPALVSIMANASDVAPGSVSLVEFYVNNVLVGSDATAPYQFDWTSVVGPASLTAKATDNIGQQTTSAAVNITVLDGSTKYTIGTVSDTCLGTGFCLPVTALAAVDNVIGYDMTIQYDNSKVIPSGVITVSDDLINPSFVSTDYVDSNSVGRMHISVFFNASASASAEFNGLGDILCVGFNKLPAFGSVDTAYFSMVSLEESYFTSVLPAVTGSGKFFTYKDTVFHAGLRFWGDNQPIKYDISNPAQYLISNIYGNNASCNALSAVAVQPNLSGNFDYNIGNGTSVTIKRDIAASPSQLPMVMNGADALMARKIVLSTLVPNPSVYQMVAADVNMDGRISSGDVSQINQRSVLSIPEFKQAWNYTNAGTPIPGAGPSKDWNFLDSSVTLLSSAYQISSTYPSDNGIGYSKSRVPVAPFCLPVPMANFPNCPDIRPETYKGVMLGDIDGTYAGATVDGEIKKIIAPADANAKVVFDMANAVLSGTFIDVPVYISTTDVATSFDFGMKFNEADLSYNTIVKKANDPSMEITLFYHADKTLRFTSNTLQQYSSNAALVSVRFNVLGGIEASDLLPEYAIINGVVVKSEVTPFVPTSINDINVNNMVSIYPNPAINVVNVVVAEKANVQLLDAEGRQVVEATQVNPGAVHSMNLEALANGVYMMKISNDNFVTTKKVVINK